MVGSQPNLRFKTMRITLSVSSFRLQWMDPVSTAQFLAFPFPSLLSPSKPALSLSLPAVRRVQRQAFVFFLGDQHFVVSWRGHVESLVSCPRMLKYLDIAPADHSCTEANGSLSEVSMLKSPGLTSFEMFFSIRLSLETQIPRANILSHWQLLESIHAFSLSSHI